MSDILIKGMEMPKNCAKCQFSDVFEYPPDYYAEWICELNHISMSWEDTQIRNSNCPLIEVPTPHGRLIEEPKQLSYDGLAYISPYDVIGTAKYFLDQIRAMPTIIEADSDVMLYPQVDGITPIVIKGKAEE